MTQFLLVQSAGPYPAFPDLVFAETVEDQFLAKATSTLFPDTSIPVWSVSPPGDEVGVLAYEGRDALFEGETIEDTKLGQLLGTCMDRGDRFCLFYSDDFLALPSAGARVQVLAALQEQLSVDNGANLELYLAWTGDA